MSRRLGGRSEVVKTPVVELLGYMLMDKEEAKAKAEAERNKTWIHYNMLLFARPSFGEEPSELKSARSQFERTIRPKAQNKNVSAPPEKLEWDFKLLEKFKKQQKGG